MKIKNWPDYTVNEGELPKSRRACLKFKVHTLALVRAQYATYQTERLLRTQFFGLNQSLMNEIFPLLLQQVMPPNLAEAEQVRFARRVFQAAQSVFCALRRMNGLDELRLLQPQRQPAAAIAQAA